MFLIFIAYDNNTTIVEYNEQEKKVKSFLVGQEGIFFRKKVSNTSFYFKLKIDNEKF